MNIFLRDFARLVAIEREDAERPLIAYLRSLRCPGLHAVAVYRFGNWLIGQRAPLRLALGPAYFVLQLLVQVVWGIDISRRATIGPGLYIGHFGGIFVHSDAVLGERCSLSQDVSIGIGGNGARRGVPVVGDDVYFAPGARAFGPIRIGRHAKIGANAVVHRDIPEHAVVTVESSVRVATPSSAERLAA